MGAERCSVIRYYCRVYLQEKPKPEYDKYAHQPSQGEGDQRESEYSQPNPEHTNEYGSQE